MKRRMIAVAVLLALVVCVGYTYVERWTANQNTAHEIAELARGMGLPETDPIIVRAQEIWLEDAGAGAGGDGAPPLQEEANVGGRAAEVVGPYEEDDGGTETAVDLWSGVLPCEVTYDANTENEAVMLAKLIRGEARGIWSQTEQACVVWTVLNRVDAGMYSSVYAAITAPYQFAYNAGASTYDDYGRDLTALARDVLYRWRLERSGQTDVGRVLPRGYCWYSGDGKHNYFRASYYGSGAIWFGLASPYES